MPLKNKLYKLLLIVYFLVLFLVLLTAFTPIEGIEPTVIVNKVSQVSIGFPVRITISKINVDVPIEFVGLTPSGNLDVTKKIENAGWFDLGTIPGSIGSSVIEGHYGPLKKGGNAIFTGLYSLRVGDKIMVQENGGIVLVFSVRKIAIYESSAIVPEVFLSSDGKAHLNLITCEGVWDPIQKTYSNRLVVFTDLDAPLI